MIAHEVKGRDGSKRFILIVCFDYFSLIQDDDDDEEENGQEDEPEEQVKPIDI